MKLIILSSLLVICIYSKAQPDSLEVGDPIIDNTKNASEPIAIWLSDSKGNTQKVISFKELSNLHEQSEKSISQSIAYIKFLSICSPLLNQIAFDKAYLSRHCRDSTEIDLFSFHFSVASNAILKVIGNEDDTAVVNKAFGTLRFQSEQFKEFRRERETPFRFIVKNNKNKILNNVTVKVYDYCMNVCLCKINLGDCFRGNAMFIDGHYRIDLIGGEYCIQILKSDKEVHKTKYSHKGRYQQASQERVASEPTHSFPEFNLDIE